MDCNSASKKLLWEFFERTLSNTCNRKDRIILIHLCPILLHCSDGSRVSQRGEGEAPTPGGVRQPIITTCKRNLGQGNVFTHVCLFTGVSVCCHFLSGCLVSCSFQEGVCLRGGGFRIQQDLDPEGTPGTRKASGTHPTGTFSCYHPQRSWGKVMFLQASVILKIFPCTVNQTNQLFLEDIIY